MKNLVILLVKFLLFCIIILIILTLGVIRDPLSWAIMGLKKVCDTYLIPKSSKMKTH